MRLKILIIAGLFLISGTLSAQNILKVSASEKDTVLQYPDARQPVIPIDIEPDIDASFPLPGALLGTFDPGKYFQWKSDLYDKTGIKLSASFQSMFLTTPSSHLIAPDRKSNAFGGWLLAEVQWKFNNPDADFESSITGTFDTRFPIGSDAIAPGETFEHSGVGWALDAAFLDLDPGVGVLFFEQHGKKDRFWVRVGQIAGWAILDFFRFKDARVAFSSPSLTIPLHVIPYAVPSLGLAFKWNPISNSKFYISGVVQDTNGEPNKIYWNRLFEYGNVFVGLEIGNNWIRGAGDFDHAHILIFRGDEVSISPLPSEPGWGFKVHGTKQWGKKVVFANYTYNTAQGGTFGIFTNFQHSASFGFNYLQPFNIQGEAGIGMSIGTPIEERAQLLRIRDETQYGVEIYWKMLMLSSFWVTPGMQYVINPTFNPTSDQVFAATLKFRIHI